MAMQIRTTPAVLNYHTVKPSQSIEQPKAQVEGSISFAKVKIAGTLPKVTIDQEQAFNESGLKNVKAFSADYVAYAKQKMQESIGRIASQGTEMTNVHLGGNAIADQASYNAFDQFDHEFGMVTMPKSGAQTNVIEGQLNISVQDGEITGSIRAQKPVVDNTPGRVEKYMKQYNSITIKYLGENVNLQV